MKVLLTGSTGLVGTALTNELKRQGHQVTHLVRSRKRLDDPQIVWNISRGELNTSALEGFDAVVHLAGEPIASGRWDEAKKARILNSRAHGTQLLSDALAKLENPPKVLVTASAVGYYGSRSVEELTEVSSNGRGFLAEVCRQWEQATAPASAKGIRVVHTRFGMVLSPKGGALKAMYWPFRLGIAGTLGMKGKQYLAWVALEDVVGAVLHVIAHPELRGPVNVVAPQQVTNAQFTQAMREALFPPFLPMRYWTPPAPAPLVELALGEMGRELLLASQRVRPIRLLETGYRFKHPELKPTLEGML